MLFCSGACLALYHVFCSYGEANWASGAPFLQRGGCNVFIRNVICENYFQGGGWALVRRVAQGSLWHAASDNLAGTDNYGTPSTPDSLSSFSIPFAGIVNNNTQLLFATGLVLLVKSNLHKLQIVLLVIGDFTSFLITTHGAVYNNGTAYRAQLRTISISSTSLSPCMVIGCCIRHL